MSQMVADSSSLILLARCNLVERVCDLFEVIVPPAVTSEVASQRLVREYSDASLISDLISKGAIRTQSVARAGFPLSISLDQGEKEALLLAIELGKLQLATDDGKAIKAARFLGVPFAITPKIVVELHRLQRISFKMATESSEMLGRIGRYSPEIIGDALLSLVEQKNGKADNRKDT